MTPPRYLTKTRFKLATECPRKLHYAARPHEYADHKQHDEFLQALAEDGHQVGALAQCYHPGGELVETLDHDQAVAETDALLARDQVVVHEAALRTGPYFIRVDVLVKDGDQVGLIEVKAKSYDPGATEFWTRRGPRRLYPKWAPYLDDVAFQTWVARGARPDWTVHPYLMLVDKSRPADAESLHQLFRIERAGRRVETRLTDVPTAERLGRHILAKVDVAADVEAIISGQGRDPASDPLNARPLADRAAEYAGWCTSDESAPITVGAKCRTCEFRTDAETAAAGLRSGYEECWRSVLGDAFDPDEPHVFEIWNCRKTADLLAQGIHRMADVPVGVLDPRQRLQVDVTLGRRDADEVVDPALFAKMATWTFPLHFVDFETIAPAIPFHAGLRPYQDLAFQFSCHHVHADGTITHDEWLSRDAGAYPNFGFLTALRASLGDDGTVFRYAAHETTILNHLADQLRAGVRPVPDGFDVADHLDWIASLTNGGARAMVDMCDLVKRHYYHRAMRNSNSIKAVLPAVMSASAEIERLYARPLDFGTNLRGMTLWARDPATGRLRDPYALLPPLFADVDPGEVAFLDRDDEVREGGAAMTAWARMQFCEMGAGEREAIAAGLLRYCELDTLAMVMVWQHWGALRRGR